MMLLTYVADICSNCAAITHYAHKALRLLLLEHDPMVSALEIHLILYYASWPL